MAGTGPAAATSFGTSQTTSSPAAVSRNPGGFTVFARGSDGAVWYRDYVGGSWGKWVSIGGKIPAGTGPAVCSWGSGRLDVFTRGTDAALWHKAYSGTSWSTNWDSLGGALTSGPSAVSPFTFGVIDVLVRGNDGGVWQKSYNNGWSGRKSAGGKVTLDTGPAVSQDLWLIAQGSTDHQLWHWNLEDAGTGWESLGVAPPEALSTSSSGAVCTVVNEHTLVCFSSTSGNVYYGVHDVTGLISQWYSLGSLP